MGRPRVACHLCGGPRTDDPKPLRTRHGGRIVPACASCVATVRAARRAGYLPKHVGRASIRTIPHQHVAQPAGQVIIDQHLMWVLDAWTWRINNSGYVVRSTSQRTPDTPHPRHVNIYLHRQLKGLSPGDPREVDHINKDPLDNRIRNLEIVTRDENQRRKYQP